MNNPKLARAVRLALLGAVGVAAPAIAQEDAPPDELEEIVVTGTRITVPGLESSSPIYSIGESEIELQQQPEIEKILRLLPITVPGEGQNVNNGSDGVATIDLRGLGSERTLVMVNGKRLTPFGVSGQVDTSTIPTALIERIDIITGGASAVYGSDAMAGVVNFIMKDDFEGIDFTAYWSQTDEGDGDRLTAFVVMGLNSEDGRGNLVANLNWTDREAVLMGARPLGQLGINSGSGAGLAEFLAGQPPVAPASGCGGPGAVDSVEGDGSTTTLPTRLAIAGAPGLGPFATEEETGLGQFRDDGSLLAPCSVFNFNPFNYYQTPQERVGGMVLGHFEMNEHAEAYGRFLFSNTGVTSQVAPSGIFGTAFFTPLSNPFISDQARELIIDAANEGIAAGTVNLANTPNPDDPGEFLFHNWNDVNGNGVVDAADDLNLSYRRRTVEFGGRTRAFDRNAYSLLTGLRGTFVGQWSYDLSFQYGETNSSQREAGFSNVANIANAVNAVPGPDGEPGCRTGGSACVPINLFGGFGSITPEMAAYASATALLNQRYTQLIYSGSVNGTVEQVQSPLAALPIAVSAGAEYREEEGSFQPDECLKLPPSSCLGGRGGNSLPIVGGFDTTELFGEFILPLVSDRTAFRSLSLEAGYRWSDYNPTGINRTWKYGLNWQPTENLLFRAMQQRAARAPNVGELAAPNTRGLGDATLDPCSVANAGNIDAELEALCISTGMSAAQVGVVENIVADQINTFEGTDLDNLPEPEEADTTTIGVVWTPDFLDAVSSPTISLDYYNIEIKNVIGEFTAQEVLDGCYKFGLPEECAKIRRAAGTLTLQASGVEAFTTNLDYLQAEGLELNYSFGVGLGDYGDLTFSGNVNHYLTQESQASAITPVLECVGHFGSSCDPLPETRWINRTIWSISDFQVSALWRHIGPVDVLANERADTLDAFEHIDAFDYIDLVGTWQVNDQVRLQLSIDNVFGEDPPVVGNGAGDTDSNGGNTFPSHYNVLGARYTVGINMIF